MRKKLITKIKRIICFLRGHKFTYGRGWPTDFGGCQLSICGRCKFRKYNYIIRRIGLTEKDAKRQ